MNRLLEFCWRDDFLFSFFVTTNFITFARKMFLNLFSLRGFVLFVQSPKASTHCLDKYLIKPRIKKNDVTAALFVLEIQRDQLLHQLFSYVR